MSIENSAILVTGAAGGIGSATARRLAAAGARLLLTDFRAEPLEELATELDAAGAIAAILPADLSRQAERGDLAAAAADFGVDTLINVAGVNPFGLFEEQSDVEIERAISINTIAPILLCRALLPVLSQRREAHIVNVGSVFGSIGYPGFAVYSASKYAVRGFTEALRRELADTPIRLHYVAPRATRTALRTDRVAAMNAELGVATDEPETVAAAIEGALLHSRREVYVGRAERLFALLNGLAPRVIDRALLKQLPIMRRYAASDTSDHAREGMVETSHFEIMGVQQ